MIAATALLLHQISAKSQPRSATLPKYHPMLIVIGLTVIVAVAAMVVLSRYLDRRWVRPPQA